MAKEKDSNVQEVEGQPEAVENKKTTDVDSTDHLDFEYDSEEFRKNLQLYSKIIDRSDDIVATIYKFMNKTLDAPSKAEIEL